MTAAPERSCVVCRKRLPQDQLQRWVVTGGEALADSGTRADGRGYYSCPDCTAKAPMVVVGRSKARAKQQEKANRKRGA